MAIQTIAKLEKPGLIMVTGSVCGFVLKEWGPHIIPPIRIFHSSMLNFSEADLRDGSPLLIAVQKNGGDVEEFKKQARAWLEKQPGQKEVRTKAKKLAQKYVKTE